MSINMENVKSSPPVPQNPGSHNSNKNYNSPRNYAAKILDFASRSPYEHIYSGYIYRQLAAFLNPGPPRHINIDVTTNPASPVVYVYAIAGGSKSSITKTTYTSFEHPSFTSVPSPPPENGGQVVWIQGFPSPEWINAIGAQYRIDPEFFRRFLSFLSTKDSYDIPSPPSSSDIMLTIRLPTICQRSVALTRSEIETARAEAADSVRQHQQKLNPNCRYGDSIVRKYSVFDGTTFVVEQDIVLHLKSRGRRGWLGIALVCSDAGKDLADGLEGPWLNDRSNMPPSCQPIIVCVPKMALLSHTNHGNTERSTSQEGSLHPTKSQQSKKMPQSISLLAGHFGSPSVVESISGDVQKVVNEVLVFAVAAECQFLNMTSGLVDREEQLQSSVRQTEWSLANLRYFKVCIDDHVRNIESVLSSLKSPHLNSVWKHDCNSGGGRMSSTPSISSSKPVSSKVDLQNPCACTGSSATPVSPVSPSFSPLLTARIADYVYLQNEANKLSRRCVENITILTSLALLAESKQAIVQADGLRRLTLLAFFFLPISLTTSFFGMNFREFGTGGLSLWVGFLVGFPIVGLSCLLCFWDSVKDCWRKLKR